MPIVMNDPASASANRIALSAATGTVVLPRGVVYLDGAITHTSRNNGLRLLGNGTELRNIGPSGNALHIDGRTGNNETNLAPVKLGAYQVGFLSHWGGKPGGEWFYRDRQIRYTGKVPAGSDGLSLARLLRRAQILPDMPAGSDRFECRLVAMPKVGDTCRVTDGKWINELTFDVRTVAAIEGRTVILDRGLSRDFLNPAACFPSEPKRLHYEGLTFTAPEGPLAAVNASHLTYDGCEFTRAPGYPGTNAFVTPINCAYVDFLGCRFPGRLHFGTSHDCQIVRCDVNWLSAEEDTHHIRMIGGGIGPEIIDSATNCHSWELAGIDSTARVINVYDNWLADGLRLRGSEVLCVRGKQARLMNISTDGPVTTEASYQGGSAESAKGVTMDGVRARGFWLDPAWPVVQTNCVAGLTA